jgi:hypothetical protein
MTPNERITYNREQMKHITDELRVKVIGWINSQDIFRTHALFDFLGMQGTKSKIPQAGCVYRLLEALRKDEYIQGLEKDQYVVLRKAPFDTKMQ